MKQTAIMLVVLGTFITGNPSVQAESENPFGFETQTHPLKYEYCQKDKDPQNSALRGHEYKCSSAPRTHPDFQEYFLTFVEDVGLCSIMANSNHFFLREKLRNFERFKDQIAQKYGPPTSKTERGEPQYNWWPQGGFNGLGNVESIELFGDIFSEGRKIRASVSFTFATSDACQKEIDDKADRAF